MRRKICLLTDRFIALAVSIVLILAASLFGVMPRAYAATNVLNRFDKIADPAAGALTTHLVGFTYTDFTTPIGSLLFEFCGNSPLLGDVCTPPSGFDLANVILGTQSGETGFTVHPNSTSNALILTRPAFVPTQGSSVYELQNVLNPNQTGTYYLRVQTFTATDATGISVQEGGIAISVNGPLTVSTEVPPFLNFCVSVTIANFDCSTANSFFIDLGEFSKTQPKVASSQMAASTNAGFGYSIFVAGTTITSGNNTIPALLTPTPSAPGTSQFGINLRSNSQPSIGEDPQGPGTASANPSYAIPDRYMFVPGDSVASGVVSQDWRKFTVSYVVNIGNGQPAGIYATTLTYICLANF